MQIYNMKNNKYKNALIWLILLTLSGIKKLRSCLANCLHVVYIKITFKLQAEELVIKTILSKIYEHIYNNEILEYILLLGKVEFF